MQGDKGRSLTAEEIAEIKHTITPLEKIPHREHRFSQYEITANIEYKKRRLESVNKNRG